MKLNNLTLEAFRGATQPVTIHFDPEKPISMIFAENGNGKSTIADALTCLLTENKGSIEDKSETEQKYLKSIGKTEAKISLNTSNGTFFASIKGTARTIEKNPETGLLTLKFLRRKMIVNLIESKASERYKELKDFIDVAEIFKCEDELRKAKRTAESDYNTIISVIAESNETLERAWIEEGRPSESYLNWAEVQAAKDISDLALEAQKYSNLKSKWSNILSKYESYQVVKETFIAAQLDLQSKGSKLEVAKLQNEVGDVSLLELLEKAKKHIEHKEEIDICPVCSNDMDKDEVLASLSSRISTMNVLKSASDTYASSKINYDQKKAILDREIIALNTLLTVYKILINEFALSVQTINDFISNLVDHAETNISIFETNKNHLDDLNVTINHNEEKKSKELIQHNLIVSQFNSISKNKIKAEKLESLVGSLGDTLEIVETSRKEFIETELESISEEVDRLYSSLHPGEQIGNIKLFLKPNAQSSLVLGGSFHTEMQVAPQSLYSESHLDTLGVCIFIALAKKYGDNNTILLLDDVMMSVDENHLDRFINLLHTEASNFGHILITTHYRPWRDRYRNNRAPGGKVHFLELRNWTIENGIKVYNGKLILGELRQLINNPEDFHRENIASTAGRMLENILDYLSIKFQSKLARKPKNDYTLSELINGFSSNLLKVLKVEHFSKDTSGIYTILIRTVYLEQIINKLKTLNAIRNQVGAHFNFDGSLVSDNDVIDFGKTTIELAELLICPNSGNLPNNNSSGSYWRTSNGSIRLYPLNSV
jgi:ABC-type transport system involved in cytochrome c biogenesis ATPase subunit